MMRFSSHSRSQDLENRFVFCKIKKNKQKKNVILLLVITKFS